MAAVSGRLLLRGCLARTKSPKKRAAGGAGSPHPLGLSSRDDGSGKDGKEEALRDFDGGGNNGISGVEADLGAADGNTEEGEDGENNLVSTPPPPTSSSFSSSIAMGEERRMLEEGEEKDATRTTMTTTTVALAAASGEIADNADYGGLGGAPSASSRGATGEESKASFSGSSSSPTETTAHSPRSRPHPNSGDGRGQNHGNSNGFLGSSRPNSCRRRASVIVTKHKLEADQTLVVLIDRLEEAGEDLDEALRQVREMRQTMILAASASGGKNAEMKAEMEGMRNRLVKVETFLRGFSVTGTTPEKKPRNRGKKKKRRIEAAAATGCGKEKEESGTADGGRSEEEGSGLGEEGGTTPPSVAVDKDVGSGDSLPRSGSDGDGEEIRLRADDAEGRPTDPRPPPGGGVPREGEREDVTDGGASDDDDDASSEDDDDDDDDSQDLEDSEGREEGEERKWGGSGPETEQELGGEVDGGRQFSSPTAAATPSQPCLSFFMNTREARICARMDGLSGRIDLLSQMLIGGGRRGGL